MLFWTKYINSFLYFFLSFSLSYFYTLYFYAAISPPSGCLWNILFIYLFTETGSTVLAPSVAKDDLEVLLLPLHPQGVVAGTHLPWFHASDAEAQARGIHSAGKVSSPLTYILAWPCRS